jgi:hypothetical protein
MTTLTYTNSNAPSTGRVHHKRLTGTAHAGPHWVNAVRVLRTATENAVAHAGQRRSATPDRVGSDIIDQVGELDPKSLHVLAMVFGMIVRASRRDHQ